MTKAKTPVKKAKAKAKSKVPAKPAPKIEIVDDLAEIGEGAEGSAKLQLFVAEYPKDFNGAQAAIRAGYSARTAAQAASRLLSNVKVQKLLVDALEGRIERTRVDADWLLLRLQQEANADANDLYTEDGAFKPVSEWPEIWRKGLVVGMEVEELYSGTGKDRVNFGRVTKVRLSERAKRLEMIGRHVDVSAFRDNITLSGKNGGPVPVSARVVIVPAKKPSVTHTRPIDSEDQADDV